VSRRPRKVNAARWNISCILDTHAAEAEASSTSRAIQREYKSNIGRKTVAVRKTKASLPDANALARAAGLDKAVRQFPEDVAIAAQSAASARGAAGALDQFAAEPWPPMQVRNVK